MPAALALAGCVALTPRSRPPGPQAVVVPGVPVRAFGTDRCGAGALSAVLNAIGDPVGLEELDRSLPRASNGGVLSVDLLLAARARGHDAVLVAGSAGRVRDSVLAGRPAILMLRVLNAPRDANDLHHYVVVDGYDAAQGLFRVQFGDGEARWIRIERIERAWSADGHALLEVSPRNPDRESREARLDRALAEESAGRTERAIVLYREIVADDPGWALAWTNLGNAESGAGRRAEAEAAYRRAIALEPGNPTALNNLAWLLLEEGTRLDEAEAMARRALEASGPDTAAVRDTLERILRARGKRGARTGPSPQNGTVTNAR